MTQATTYTSMGNRKISPYVYPGIDVKPGDVEFANFLSCVATSFGTSTDRILSPSRDQQLVEIRQCMWHVLYNEEKKNYSRLARMFNRDHATVLYGVKKVNNLFNIGDQQIIDTLRTIFFIHKSVKRHEQTKDY